MEEFKEIDKYTWSEQVGSPGHCIVAQVWDGKGESVCRFDSTEDVSVSSTRARILAEALNIHTLTNLTPEQMEEKLSNQNDLIRLSEALRLDLEARLKEAVDVIKELNMIAGYANNWHEKSEIGIRAKMVLTKEKTK